MHTEYRQFPGLLSLDTLFSHNAMYKKEPLLLLTVGKKFQEILDGGETAPKSSWKTSKRLIGIDIPKSQFHRLPTLQILFCFLFSRMKLYSITFLAGPQQRGQNYKRECL